MTQPGRERQADAGVDLGLVHALEFVLDRVLEGEHVAGLVRDRGESGVQRGGLARPGRAGDQDQALRAGERGHEAGAGLGREPEAADEDAVAAAGEQAQHRLLAVQGRHGRDPQVDFAEGGAQPGAAVLGQPALGDVEFGHDLDARDQLRGERLGQVGDLAQHAVDAHAHAQPARIGLEVQVAGPRLDGVGDEPVEQLHDRLLVDRFVGFLRRGCGGRTTQGEFVAVGAAPGHPDRRCGRDLGPDVPCPGEQTQVVEQPDVGVGGGDHEAPPVDPERQHVEPFGDLGGDQRERLPLRAHHADVDTRQPQPAGDRVGDVVLAAQPEPHDRVAESLAPLLAAERDLDVAGGQGAGRDQQFADARADPPTRGWQGRQGCRRRSTRQSRGRLTPSSAPGPHPEAPHPGRPAALATLAALAKVPARPCRPTPHRRPCRPARRARARRPPGRLPRRPRRQPGGDPRRLGHGRTRGRPRPRRARPARRARPGPVRGTRRRGRRRARLGRRTRADRRRRPAGSPDHPGQRPRRPHDGAAGAVVGPGPDDPSFEIDLHLAVADDGAAELRGGVGLRPPAAAAWRDGEPVGPAGDELAALVAEAVTARLWSPSGPGRHVHDADDAARRVGTRRDRR